MSPSPFLLQDFVKSPFPLGINESELDKLLVGSRRKEEQVSGATGTALRAQIEVESVRQFLAIQSNVYVSLTVRAGQPHGETVHLIM
jgi:hypothetical protein